jgi:hypothetical protein
MDDDTALSPEVFFEPREQAEQELNPQEHRGNLQRSLEDVPQLARRLEVVRALPGE